MKRVLFVCVENANRSQMAEVFARIHGGAVIDAHSAGSKPSGIINPKAIRFMAEVVMTSQPTARRPSTRPPAPSMR